MYCARLQRMKMEGFPSTRAHPAPVFSKEAQHSARLQNMKIETIVMPAWIAGIQVCKDASGNIPVDLDSSTPCWNDALCSACSAPPWCNLRVLLYSKA